MRFRNLISIVFLAAAAMMPAQTTLTITPDPIVGTWAVQVPGATPAEDFFAIQTFHQDGTFTETSSLLATLVEGPAQGTWRRDGNSYKLTFLLFTFGEDHAPAGYIRVRATIKVGGDRLDAETFVDFIGLDGKVEPEVGQGPYFGFRQKLDLPANIADVPHTSSRSGETIVGGGEPSGAAADGVVVRRAPAKRGWSGFAKR